jgi:DNA-binding NarL/FixJ family response regulator
MINIAIADPNETFCRSLKTLLEQIDGFSVITIMENEKFIHKSMDDPVNVLLIDIGLYLDKCNPITAELARENNSMKIILLAMYEDDFESGLQKVEVILKSAGKEKFETRIRQLASAEFLKDISVNTQSLIQW